MQAAGPETAEEALLRETQVLQHRVAVLDAQVAGLQQALAAQVPAQPPPPPPPPPQPRRKCPISVPEKYNGQPLTFNSFLGQCELFMRLRPDDFPDDPSRIGFIINLLIGHAARWATPILNQGHPLMANYQAFRREFVAAFQDPVREHTAARRLKTLKQGRRPLADYIADFRAFKQDCNWNEEALVYQFHDGLSDEMLDELVRADPPQALEPLILFCQRIDARIQRRRDIRAERGSKPPSAPQRPFAALPRFNPPQPPAQDEPMEIGRARPRLTEAEKARRRQGGLCLYCGGPGHFANVCPQKTRAAPRTATRLQAAIADEEVVLLQAAQTAENANGPV